MPISEDGGRALDPTMFQLYHKHEYAGKSANVGIVRQICWGEPDCGIFAR
jgi:hypothetical protein